MQSERGQINRIIPGAAGIINSNGLEKLGHIRQLRRDHRALVFRQMPPFEIVRNDEADVR